MVVTNRGDYITMAQKLNPQQKIAVQAAPGPVLIVAGAGTGKTKTLTSRLLYLIEERRVPAERICAITFTNKAAKEMRDRLSLGTKQEGTGPFIGTFHSLGAKILRTEGRRLRRTADFAIFDDSDSASVLRKILKKLRPAPDKEKGRAFFAQKISGVKNGVIDLAKLEASLGEEGLRIARVYEEYEAALEANNAFDFDDLIQKVVMIFERYPPVLEKYEEKFRHVLVDEYQDVNPMQYKLLKLLARKHRSLSAVGDDHQMIYSWRYANLETFLGFEKDWPDASIVLLEENYRSPATIIEAASALIRNNERQRPKSLWTKNGAGESIRIVEAADEDKEAEWIAGKIAEGARRGEGTMAVLYRTNAQSRALEQALMRRRIEYRIFGGLKFYERREIKDIVAALRYASNPKDSVSRDRLLKAFSRRTFLELEEKLIEGRPGKPADIISAFLKTTDYFSWIKKEFPNARERLENIGELLHFASRFDDLSGLLEEIALLQTTDTPVAGERQAPRKDSENGLVNLMTIHLAKGLEFDHVYLAGCSEGLLPHARSSGSSQELEEERRLMYVAMTRARKRLSISFYGIPSRFLSEVPESAIEFKDLASGNETFADSEERYISVD
ncbi:ATP-dependent DNA helicase PcrA [Candidatus Parcubacteria bacterium]|nr:MAG: ATP-dependent DNA helicase PcrA [Candidatus Parcubacteria bacterium]